MRPEETKRTSQETYGSDWDWLGSSGVDVGGRRSQGEAGGPLRSWAGPASSGLSEQRASARSGRGGAASDEGQRGRQRKAGAALAHQAREARRELVCREDSSGPLCTAHGWEGQEGGTDSGGCPAGIPPLSPALVCTNPPPPQPAPPIPPLPQSKLLSPLPLLTFIPTFQHR